MAQKPTNRVGAERSRRRAFGFAAVLCALGQGVARGEESFLDMELDALMQIDIASVARRPMNADDTPAATFVVSQEDIRRTGATTVPELLRLVPGFEVADIDNSYSAVAARGFNWRSSNKLLILIDGRSIYRSAFSGVLWDQQIVAVEEIDRIEVLRGPGAALWGANAVNGVVNIVTKHAVDSLGAKAVVRYGTDDSGRFYVREGFRLGRDGAMRLYATGLQEPALLNEADEALTEPARGGQVGFRVDWEPNDRDAFTLQGDAIDFEAEQPLLFFTPQAISPTQSNEQVLGDSYNILGRWVRTFGVDHGLNVQAYVDDLSRQEIDDGLTSNATTYSLEATHYFPLSNNQRVVWGLGFSRADVNLTSIGAISLAGLKLRDDNFFGFLHNDVDFFDGRLTVSTGLRLEYNSRSQWEAHPNIRAIWRGPDGWRFWGAVSRATRTPNLTETRGTVDFGGFAASSPLNPTTLPIFLSLEGNEQLESEPLLAFEIGARKKWGGRAAFDIALYAHRYKDLIDVALQPVTPLFAPLGPGGAPIPVAFDLQATFANSVDADVYGIEAAFDAQLADFWDIRFSADARQFPEFDGAAAQLGGSPAYLARRSPTYQIRLQSNFEIREDLDASIWVRRVGAVMDANIDPLTKLDVRLGWRPTERLEVTFLGEGLADRRRPAATNLNFIATEPGFSERRFSLQLGARF